MKKIFLLYFTLNMLTAFGQAAKPVFAYSQKSIIALLNDGEWIKANTGKYLSALNERYAHKQVDKVVYLYKKIQSNIILDQYAEGIKTTSSLLTTEPDLPFGVSYLAVFNAYLTQAIQHKSQAYIPAIRAAFKKTGASDLDWYAMKKIMTVEDGNGAATLIGYATADNAELIKYFESRIHSFTAGGGSFNLDEMSAFIRIAAYRKISKAIKGENGKLMKELALTRATGKKQTVKKIDETFSAVFQDSAPGAAVVLMEGNEILLEKGYGIADINTKKRIDAHTNFNIGSISKMFTATAVLILKQQNKLSLQDPIIKYLPDVNPKIGNNITIYQLLTHTSGLPRYIESKDSVKALTATDREAYEEIKNLDTLDFKPGTKFSYSNIGYRWLTLIVENISGVAFPDFVRNNILLPANMQNSYEMKRGFNIPNFAHAYKLKSKVFTEYDDGEEPQFNTMGDGGLVSNITDFKEWERALRSNTILSKEIFNESISPQVSTTEGVPNSSYGYGWFIEKTPGHATVYSHSGQNGSFISYFFRIPAKNIMGVILMNREDKFSVYDYVIDLLKNSEWY